MKSITFKINENLNNNLYKEIYNIVYFKNNENAYRGFSIEDIKRWGAPKASDNSQYAKVYRDLQQIRKNLKLVKNEFSKLPKEYIEYKNLWTALSSKDFDPENYRFSDSTKSYDEY